MYTSLPRAVFNPRRCAPYLCALLVRVGKSPPATCQHSGASDALVARVPELEGLQEPLRRPRRSQRGQSLGRLQEELRRAHRGPGGVGCSGGK